MYFFVSGHLNSFLAEIIIQMFLWHCYCAAMVRSVLQVSWCLTVLTLTFRLSQQAWRFGYCVASPLAPCPHHHYWISACPALISALEFQGVKQDPPSKGCTLQWRLEESDDKHTNETTEAGGSKRGNGIENYSGEGWSEVKWSRSVVSDSSDWSPPGSSVHGIFQAIVLEWLAISFSRGSSQPRDRTQVSHIVDRRFTVWATREGWVLCYS